jgi:hypothetical protein
MFRFPSFRRKAQEQKSGSEESRLTAMANIQQTRRRSVYTAVFATTTNLTSGGASSNHINPNPNQPPQEVPLRRDIQAGCLEAAIPIEAVSSPRGLSSWPRGTTTRASSLYPDVTSSLLFLEQGRQASFDPGPCTVPLVTATPVFSCSAHHGDSFSSAMNLLDRQEGHSATTPASTSRFRTRNSPAASVATVAAVAIDEGIPNIISNEKPIMMTVDRFFQHNRSIDSSRWQQQRLWDDDDEKEIQDIVLASAKNVWDDYVAQREKEMRERPPHLLTPEMIEQQRQADRKVQQTIFNVANEAWEKTLIQQCH